MTSRPLAADDFDFIRNRVAELKAEAEAPLDARCFDDFPKHRVLMRKLTERITFSNHEDGLIYIDNVYRKDIEVWAEANNYTLRWVSMEDL